MQIHCKLSRLEIRNWDIKDLGLFEENNQNLNNTSELSVELHGTRNNRNKSSCIFGIWPNEYTLPILSLAISFIFSYRLLVRIVEIPKLITNHTYIFSSVDVTIFSKLLILNGTWKSQFFPRWENNLIVYYYWYWNGIILYSFVLQKSPLPCGFTLSAIVSSLV